MVKTKLHLPLLCFTACVALFGCSAVRQVVDVRTESLTLAAGPLGPTVSLADAPDALVAVYTDPATTTIDAMQLPVAPHLPAAAPVPAIIDKIDTAPPLAAGFGQHVLAIEDGRVSVLYEDRKTDTKTVLKVASRLLTEGQWRLDVLEPAGDPVALLPGPGGQINAFWSADGLLSHVMAAPGDADTITRPFRLGSRPALAGPDAFTAFDAESGKLLAVSRAGEGWSTTSVDGAAAIQASLVTPRGILAVVSWDARTRHLLLHEARDGERGFSTTTVTICNETTNVALLPGPSPTTYLFVFDETRAGAVGTTTHQVSLIAPGPVLGAIGGRYRKAVLCSDEKPVQSLSALVVGKSLYVLVLQGDLKLIRLDLRE